LSEFYITPEPDEVAAGTIGFNEDSCHGVFDLDPGAYVLICNLVEMEDGEIEAPHVVDSRRSAVV